MPDKGEIPVRAFDYLIQKSTSGEPPKSKVLGIGGSPRRGGNSDVLLKHTLKAVAESKVAVDSFQLRDFQYQGCVGCEKCRKDKSDILIKAAKLGSDLAESLLQ